MSINPFYGSRMTKDSMVEIKLFDSELKIMEVLWNEGDVSAKHLAAVLGKQVGWSKTTTYTIIKKCIDKGAIERTDPDFLCHALITREQAQEFETNELIRKMYGGAEDRLIASLLGWNDLTAEEIEHLKMIVHKKE